MKLSIRAVTLSSALTTLIMTLLLLPLHLLHRHAMMLMAPGARSGGMMPGMMPHDQMTFHAQLGSWPVIAWILLALAVIVVYAGVAGFIFGAIYNAFAPKQS